MRNYESTNYKWGPIDHPMHTAKVPYIAHTPHTYSICSLLHSIGKRDPIATLATLIATH